MSKAPTISGTAQVGKTLTANLGTVSPSDAKVAYQWLANGRAIGSATAKTYTPTTNAYLGWKLSVTVTATEAGYTRYTKTSAQTAKVAAGTLASAGSVMRGEYLVGTTLTAVPGTWTPGTHLSYQWYAGGKPIAGATNSALALTSAQYNKKVYVSTTGTKSGYTTVTRFSGMSGFIGAGTLTGSRPTISASGTVGGAPLVGATLTAHPGAWTGGTALHYQWYANSHAISGATSSTYKIPANLLGHTFLVRIIGSKTGYHSLGENSNSTAAAVQTKAYYTAHSGNKTTYEVIVTGLEGDGGADIYGDPGAASVLWEPYGTDTLNEADGSGATGYYKVLTLANAPSSWLLLGVVVDPGYDDNFNPAYATVSIYEKPAGAPDAYYSLHKEASGSSVFDVELYGGQ